MQKRLLAPLDLLALFSTLMGVTSFQKIFTPIGYTLNINRSLKVVQLINSYGYGRVSFRKYESIILLILRLLYIEKREKLSTNTEKVYVTAAEIKTEYEKLNLPKNSIRDCLRIH